jgi:hypothetical protein
MFLPSSKKCKQAFAYRYLQALDHQALTLNGIYRGVVCWLVVAGADVSSPSLLGFLGEL